MNLIAFCIKRPVTTIMFFTALMILGIFSGLRMPIDLLPEISYPAISISTRYSGAGPEEIERLITIPLEQSVSTINRVKSITSVSEEGSSRVTVFFDWGLNLDESVNDIRANLDRVRRRLPDGADQPTLFKHDPSSSPVVTLGLSGDMDETTLRQLAEEDLSYQIQKVDGVASVEVRGGKNREIRVYLKQDRLQSLGITFDQISKAIDKANVMLPAGNLGVGVGDFLLRTKGEFTSVEDIKDLVVLYRNGVPVFLRDVAQIEEGFETTRQIVRIDGKPGIVMSVQKRSGSNTVAVADRVYKALKDIKWQYPEIKLRILNDNSTYIRQAVQGVRDSAISGAILAGLVLLLFLHSFRATLVTAVVMPISILTTLMLAYFSKMTLNTISLGGLALGVGMLVDNSVVVLDNVFRKYQNPSVSLERAANEGTSEMGPAIMASTLTTICVFFPLIFVGGQTGIIFKELSYMVTFSLLCSLMVAVTLMPMLCSKFLKRSEASENETHNIKGYLIKTQHNWENSYQKLLVWCLSHKMQVCIGSTVVFLALLCLWPLIGTELIQSSDEGLISIRVELPTGTRLEETDLLSLNIEKTIRKLVPELNNMEVSVGGSSVNRATLTLRLSDIKERQRSTEQIIALLQEKIQYPGSKIRINARSSMRMLYGGSSQNPIVIDIRGYDQELSRQVGELVAEKISRIPGVINASLSREEERPELGITINRKRAADLGVSVADIAEAVQSANEGNVATIYRKDGEEIEVRVNLQEADRKSWQDLGRIMVSGNNNRMIPLMSIVNIAQNNSPVQIDRKDQERNMTVEAGLMGRDLASAMKDIKKVVNQISLPMGVTIFYAGDFEEQQKSFSDLRFALLLSLILVYMVMAAQFESYLDPFIIMLVVPFTLGGVLLMLILTDTVFNNQVYIGLIVLGGVVVNNAIVLISYIRMLMERGMDLEEAVITSGRSRLRPILITTITTILGLVPLALGIGEGSKMQAPMARTVIGGLTFSTIITLVLIPVVFVMIENWIKQINLTTLRKAKRVAMVFLVITGLISLLPGNIQAATSDPLTLKEAVQLALKQSETGKIIQAKRIQINAIYAENNGEKKIQVTSGLETTADKDGSETAVTIEAERSVPLTNLTGIPSLSDRIITYNRNISILDIKAQEEEHIYDVVASYQAEILAGRAVKIAEDNYNRSKRLYDEVATRSKLGLTTIIDENGAEAQLAGALTSLNRARQNYRIAGLKLRQLLSLDSTAQLELSLPEQPTIAGDLPSLLSEALRQRADVQQAREEMSRAEKLFELAKLSERLGIGLDWNFERDHFTTGIGVSNRDKDGTTEEWNIHGNAGAMAFNTGKSDTYDDNGKLTLKLTWKLWDGNVRKERIKQAEAVLTQASETVKKIEKGALLEVEEVYYTYLNQIDKVQSGALQLKYNQTYLAAVEAKLRTGLSSVKDVLDAQLLLNEAESNQQTTIHALFMTKIELLKAIGQLNLEKL